MKYILFFCLLFQMKLFSQIDSIYSFNRYEEKYPDSTIEIQTVYEYNEKNNNSGFTIIEKFHSNGQLKCSYMVNNNYELFGLCKEFYKQGSLKSICTYYRSVIVGLKIDYYENGQVESIGNYKNISSSDSIIYVSDTMIKIDSSTGGESMLISSYPKQTKIGTWCYFNPNGDLIRKEEYSEDGILISK